MQSPFNPTPAQRDAINALLASIGRTMGEVHDIRKMDGSGIVVIEFDDGATVNIRLTMRSAHFLPL